MHVCWQQRDEYLLLCLPKTKPFSMKTVSYSFLRELPLFLHFNPVSADNYSIPSLSHTNQSSSQNIVNSKLGKKKNTFC